MAHDGPVYHRPIERPAYLDALQENGTGAFPKPATGDAIKADLLALLASPNVASKRWVFEQYDRMVQGQTVAGPGSDAAGVRVPGTM